MIKNLILSGVNSKKYNGVIKMNEGAGLVKTNLNLPHKEYSLVIKTDEISVYYPLKSGETYKVDCDLTKSVTVLIAEGKEGVLYGSQGDKLKGFVLLSEYIKAFDKGLKPKNLVTISEDINDVKGDGLLVESVKNESEIKPDNATCNRVSTMGNSENESECEGENGLKEEGEIEGEKAEEIGGKTHEIGEKSDKNHVKNAEKTLENEENCKGFDEKLRKEAERRSAEREGKRDKEGDGLKTLKKKAEEKISEVTYKGDNFYLAVRTQIDEIFVCYPEESKLKTLVKNSKWARIDYENGYYVVGVISENDDVKYICYGIPGVHHVKPPVEVKDVARWLPLDENKPQGEGYWLTYQDAKSGKTLPNDIDI